MFDECIVVWIPDDAYLFFIGYNNTSTASIESCVGRSDICKFQS